MMGYIAAAYLVAFSTLTALLLQTWIHIRAEKNHSTAA